MSGSQPARRAPTAAPAARSDLTVVASEAPRSRHIRRTCLRLAVVLLAGLFTIGLLQAVVTQSQQRIDQLNTQIDEAQNLDRDLRLRRAQLLSPDRLASAARNRLGMVPPATVLYLDPATPPAP